MIVRTWHGSTSISDAGIYENLLKEEILVEIEKKNVYGCKGIQLLRRDLETEVEITTIMWFDNIESVKQFAGDNYETACVPSKARGILSRFDLKSIHYELRYSSQL